MVGVGATPGGYELLAKLGSGGMATLYLARRAGAAGFERLAAVKVVHSHLADDERFSLMFVDEAKLASRIHHPNVVAVEDFGEHDGTYYMAMEYVHGCSLAQLLDSLAKRRRRLEPAVAVHIAMQIAAGLHAAHETTDVEKRPLELVHRDVSPQNVLLSYTGHVKLIDFGIAKARFRARETKSVRIKGKLSYMAPEQVRMGALDRRTDVYALAILLWEMLTMRRYFQADNELALLDMIRAPTARAPSLHATIDPALDLVVTSALCADPDGRPASAHELRRALAKACPAALEVDSTELADLLASAMTDQRARLSGKLPAIVAGQLEAVAPPPRPHETGRTEELDVASVEWREDTFEETPRPEAAPEEAAPSQPAIVPPSRTPSEGTAVGSRRPIFLALGAIGIACGFGLTLGLLSDPSGSPDEPRVLPAVAPAAPAPEPPAVSPPALPAPPSEPAVAQPTEPACDEADLRCVVDTLGALPEPSPDELARLADAQLALGERAAMRRSARRYLELAPEGPEAARFRRALAPSSPRPPREPSGPAGDLPFSSTL